MSVTPTLRTCSHVVICAAVLVLGCGGPAPLTVDMPLHLEEHLDAATIVGSQAPEDAPQPVVWDFSEPQPEWRPADPIPPEWEAVRPVRVDDALRLPLTARNRPDYSSPARVGVIYVPVPNWTLEDWAYVEIRARTDDPVRQITLCFNYTREDRIPGLGIPFYSRGARAFVITDGTVQTYRLPLDSDDYPLRTWDGPWTHLAISFVSRQDEEVAALDLLSVRVIPRAHEFANEGVGVRAVKGGRYAGFEPIRRALYMHAPGKINYPVRVPEEARLDVALGVLRDDAPVTFAVTATRSDGVPDTLFEETYADVTHGGQRSVSLSHLAGETVTLALEAECEVPGTVALWASPTLSGRRASEKPNVIFYIIDGAGAEYMSLYGYNRRTTPNIDRLAAEGAVFEWAYSNSHWTRPSTPSFMTSLQHSVLGGFKDWFNVVPNDALTMAQRMHAGGYQTAVFTANPNAGKLSGLERGVDLHREDWSEFSYFGYGNYQESSKYLHDAFWDWREEYPGEPYWVHFQTVDIHADFPAVAPFGGLFVSADQARTRQQWDEQLGEVSGERKPYSEVWERIGVDRVAFFTLTQGLYDEAMAYNDYQLGRLVERLKAEGEWENTLLIVAADHGIGALWDMGVAVQDSLPPPWTQAMLRPSVTRIPLLFVWPGHIPAGQRFSAPAVSMIDALPTILDLVGLPLPEIMQGQSLAPLLLGEGDLEVRPVVLDEFEVDGETGELRGLIEVIDGRWGASLWIGQHGEGWEDWLHLRQRPVPLLVFDLWNDPMCLHSLHEERPDLVEKYTAFLEAQFEAHQALGQYFTATEEVVLTPEQLKMLRTLGYIQ